MWHARPLGLSFGEGPPLVVTKVQTPADSRQAALSALGFMGLDIHSDIDVDNYRYR